MLFGRIIAGEGRVDMAKEFPKVDCDRLHPVLRVQDIAKAVEFYTTRLGFDLGFTWPEDAPPTYAGVNLGAVQVFLQKGTPNPDGISISFVVSNADELCEAQRSRGVEIEVEPGDRAYGLRDYGARDLYRYRLSFGHYIFNAGEPIRIERVDVPVRLEKRLAGLLHDLAAYKHMSLSSCLEEILLHTNEPLGDGVASPHTTAQLRHIQELKKKHGIDYDSHGSYRFIEKQP
jgi:catechol 2,3-dioxygenase-like lactoylglutathione lyase family enzyme